MQKRHRIRAAGETQQNGLTRFYGNAADDTLDVRQETAFHSPIHSFEATPLTCGVPTRAPHLSMKLSVSSAADLFEQVQDYIDARKVDAQIFGQDADELRAAQRREVVQDFIAETGSHDAYRFKQPLVFPRNEFRYGYPGKDA